MLRVSKVKHIERNVALRGRYWCRFSEGVSVNIFMWYCILFILK